MFRQRLQIVLRPRRRGMNVAALVIHEISIADRESDGPGANAEKAANVDHHQGCICSPMNMGDLPTLLSVAP